MIFCHSFVTTNDPCDSAHPIKKRTVTAEFSKKYFLIQGVFIQFNTDVTRYHVNEKCMGPIIEPWGTPSTMSFRGIGCCSVVSF